MRYPWISLSTKLLCIAGVVTASLLVTLAVAMQQLAKIEETSSQLMLLREAQRKSQHADMVHDELRNDVLEMLMGTHERDPAEEHRQVQALCSELSDDMAFLDGMPLPPELRHVVSTTDTVVDGYVAAAGQLAWSAVRTNAYSLERKAAFDRAFRDARVALAHQTDELSKASEEAAHAASVTGQEAKRRILVTKLFTAALSAALLGMIARSIRRSLERLRDVARAVAGGAIEQRTRVLGTDEIGQLGEALNRMADHLQAKMAATREDAERTAFNAQLGNAFDMADEEPEAHAIVARAMARVSPAHSMELLLADSSKAHLERAAEHPTAGSPGCSVRSPFGCVAVRRGNLVQFTDSEKLDACPHLRGRPGGPVSAVCVPLSFMGRSLGVLHAAGPVDSPLTELQETRLRLLSAQAGSRIGTVRAFQRTQLQASTDMLTGLSNRRALEDTVRSVAAGADVFAVVLCDLDHFKRLNDEHGHAAGDAALRVFAEVLRAMLRPGDLAARWGGEEFCVVMPASGAGGAVAWADRVRARLADQLAKATAPHFTASFGVADSTMSRDFNRLFEMADAALYRAKKGGRNRAVVADGGIDDDSGRPSTDQHDAVDVRMLSEAS